MGTMGPMGPGGMGPGPNGSPNVFLLINEFLTLSFKYDIYNFYEIEMSLWFHESDSNYIFKEIINSKLFTTPPSSP